jgi:hypothetical protein
VSVPSVTYTGEEVAILAGVLAGALPKLSGDEFEVADLLLERALASLPEPLSATTMARIERQRRRPC